MAGPSFYKNVVPLNRDSHRRLRLRTDQMSFAAGTHFVPLSAVELYDAARDYPIVFAGGENASPVAILGLRSDENLFVDADGRWAEGTYVPAYVRRYPFILSGAGEASADFTVCIDESYDGLSETEGTPLFDEEGKESELVSRMLAFLRDSLTEHERSRRLVERLVALDLLTVKSMQVQDRSGKKYALQDFRMVDENKLRELDNDVIGELHRIGYLGCIYAHLVSLGNVSRLALRLPAEPAGGTAGSEPGAAG